MRVLILSQYCFPEIDIKSLPLAKKLKLHGFEVEILTGYPNQPIGKLFPGYKMKLIFSEYIEGIKIMRVPFYINHSKSKFKRILNYFSFAFSASFIGPWLIKRPDIIYVYHGPATIATPAIFLKLIFRSKIFYDINDYWPDTLSSTGMIQNKLILNLVQTYCTISYKFFDHINVVSEGFRNKLIQLNVSKSKISIIYNWSLPIKSIHSDKFDYYKNIFHDNFTIVFAGNIGMAQSLGVVIDTALKIKENSLHDINFLIIGDGIEKKMLNDKIIENKLENYITLTGSIPSNNVGEFLAAADILFLHLKKDPLFDITIPSKLGAYFVFKKPILCGVAGETCEIVKKSCSGICFEPDDSNDLFNKIIALKKLSREDLEEMGYNGNDFYKKNISLEIGINKFIKIFKEMESNK